MARKPTGTLLIENLPPGRRLHLFSISTDFAPFARILQKTDTYASRISSSFYGCRQEAELACATEAIVALGESEFLGEQSDRPVIYCANVTREPFQHTGSVTDLIASGKLTQDLAWPPLSAKDDPSCSAAIPR